jgi:nucleotide-binding universal stress UspA family protein
MKILVPTDFSENAKNAFEFSKSIAKLNNGTITLLFAYYSAYDFAAQSSKIISQIEASAQLAMEEVDSCPEHDIIVDHKIVQGSVAMAVTSTAYREDYDLIVMGTQGASGIGKALIGTNTAHVVKDSQVPVLVVPHEAMFGNVYEVAVATDLSRHENKYFETLLKLTGFWNLPFNLVHIQNQYENKKEMPLNELEKLVKQKYPDRSFTATNVPAEDTIKGIDQYLQNAPNCMLVMFYKNGPFFEYLFNKNHVIKMAYHTHVPLLVIK